MDKYEFIHVCIHKKNKETSIWEVSDGDNIRYIEIDGGKNYLREARTRLMNKLGEEGWHLGISNYTYEFVMQRKK